MRPAAGLSSTQGPVARIRTASGAICGTGLLAGERHVLTCAHVVDDAVPGRTRGTVDAPAEPVTLDLPFLDHRGLAARVVAWHPMVRDVEGTPVSDIAVLELEEPVPGGLDPRESVLSAPPEGTAFTTLGFPAGMKGGAEARGEIRMRDAGGWRHVQDTQDHGYFVAPGFSGAPVFDAEAARAGTRRLLGMVVAVDRDAGKRLAFVIPTPTLGRAWPLLVRPYKGLDAFEAEDADLFFGREEKIDELAAKIARRPFVALIGPSGSGKSSLVRAGLVPRLRAEGGWATATFKPRTNPLYGLAEALASLTPERVGDGLARRATELADRLQADPRHVLDYVPTALDAIPGAERLLLVLDQFEELFTLATAPGAIEDPATPHGAFAVVLEILGSQPPDEAPVRVVATLRADFTGHALRHGVFERLMTDADVLLGPMSPADLTDAVARPAERFDVAFDPGLVSEIVATMKDSRGGLPLMQFALDRLWQKQEDRQLTAESYRAIGGVEGALNDHAEAFRRDLSPGDQAALRRVMTRLVNLANPGTGSEDTRAVATRDQIGEADWDLVSRLAKARLVTTGGTGGETGTEIAEIAHEALIRAWSTLRTWLDEDRTFALWRQRLRHDVEKWDRKNDDALLRGKLLAEAEERMATRGRDLNQSERDYIEAGSARRRAEEEAARGRERAEAEKERRQREERVRILEEKNQALAKEADAKAKEADARANGERQQKRFVRWLSAFAGCLAIAVLGAIYFGWSAEISRLDAVEQRQVAEVRLFRAEQAESASQRSAREALGRQLAAEARLTMAEIPGAAAAERTAALSIEAWRYRPTSQAYQVASQSMLELPIVYVEHSKSVTALAFSPDGTRLATGDGDGSAYILDAKTGKEIARVEHDSWLSTLAFSPAGTRLFTGDGNGVARVLNTETGNEIARMEPEGMVLTRVFSHDGARFATGTSDGIVRIFVTETGSEVARIEHDGWVTALAFSSDAARLATGSLDGTVRILDAETGRVITRVEHNDAVQTLIFNLDGTRLAIVSGDGIARIVDSASGKVIVRVEHGGRITALAISPDGTRLATGNENGIARLLNGTTGDVITRVKHDKAVLSFAFNPAGSRLAIGSDDGGALILDAGNGDELARIENANAVTALTFNPDGTYLAIGGTGITQIVDAETGGEIGGVEYGSTVRALAFSPDGTRLASGSFDGTALLLDAGTGDEVGNVGHAGAVVVIAFSPNGASLATGSLDGTARILSTRTGNEIAVFEPGDAVRSLAYSPDGSRLAAGSDDGAASILDVETGDEIAHIEHGGEVRALAFSPDGEQLATGSLNGVTRVFDAQTGDEIARADHGGAVLTIAFGPNGENIATGSGDGFARILDAGTGENVALVEHGGPVLTIAFSPDGTRLATGSKDGTARILHAATGKEIARTAHGGAASTLAFSPDSRLLATGSNDGTARILDAMNGDEIALVEHGDAVYAVAFNSDGTRLATGSGNINKGIARIFNAESGEEVARMKHAGQVSTLAYSPDGSHFATGSSDGTTRLFDADPGKLFDRLCTERAGRNLTREEWRRYIGEDEPWRKTCPEWRTVEEISAEGQAILYPQ